MKKNNLNKLYFVIIIMGNCHTNENSNNESNDKIIFNNNLILKCLSISSIDDDSSSDSSSDSSDDSFEDDFYQYNMSYLY